MTREELHRFERMGTAVDVLCDEGVKRVRRAIAAGEDGADGIAIIDVADMLCAEVELEMLAVRSAA